MSGRSVFLSQDRGTIERGQMQLTPYQLSTANSFLETTPTVCVDPKGDLIALLQSQGFNVKNLSEGNINRFPAPDEGQSGTSGWCIYHEIEDTTEDG